MKIVYVAGPYSNPDPAIRSVNVNQAMFYTAKLTEMGLWCFSPILNSNFPGADDASWEHWLTGDLRLLAACDAIYLMPRWELSRGARREHQEAAHLKLPAFFNLNTIKACLCHT